MINHAVPTRLQRGFGLIELLVAMVIGLLMLLGILTMVIWVSDTRANLDKTSEQVENGRYAMSLLSNELQLAGFYGVPRIVADVTTTPDPCKTALADLQFGYIATKNTVPAPVYGYKAGDPLPICLSSAVANSEALVLRRVATTPVLAASLAGTAVQVSACASDTQTLRTGNTASDFSGTLLRQKNCADAVLSLWPYVSRAYFLSEPAGIRTFNVAELVNGSIQVTPLVEGIEDMHLSYGLDFNGDGSPDCFADDLAGAMSAPCTAWGSSELDRWSNVTAVRIRLLARSTDTFRDWKDTRTYDLGRADPSGPFNDGYKRQVYSAVVPLANVGGPRE